MYYTTLGPMDFAFLNYFSHPPKGLYRILQNQEQTGCFCNVFSFGCGAPSYGRLVRENKNTVTQTAF